MNQSDLERSFELWIRQTDGIPEPEREYRFHPSRRWRMDFCWPDQKVAVEIEGLTWNDKGGRHQRAQGFVADCEKHEAAQALGWIVYRVPGPWIQEGERAIWRPKTMETLKELLRRTE